MNSINALLYLKWYYTNTFPGVDEAGHYDKFEGGNGQGIAYSDVSANNEGDYRTDEGADVAFIQAEGATLGWIAGGEWVEYTIEVASPGLYDMSFRFASDNQNGGGPFQLELDGEVISDPIALTYTNGWNDWETMTINDLPLSGGDNVLRLAFENGEFNLGKMTFTRSADLPYSQPVANAGDNVVVVMPDTQATLDGAASSDPDGGDLTYSWTQIFGPSTVTYANNTSVSTEISGLEEGVYLFELAVSNDERSDKDELFVIVSETSDIAPFISIVSPEDNAEFIEGKTFSIRATASDLDGTVDQVEFFVDDSSIGAVTEEPFNIDWAGEIGTYSLTAVATDNGGATATSQAISVDIKEAPSCAGQSPNGDFSYLFSDDAENPTLTFIPNQSGVGSPTCLLYYATSQGQAFPGYPVTPNVPFTLNAEAGSTVYFYYTYTFPGLGDKTTIDDVLSYKVGTCRSEEEPATLDMANATMSVDENSAEGTVIGMLSANYTGMETLNYAITAGNDAEAFALNESTGELTVANTELLDFETATSFTLSIDVTDGTLTASAILIININDVNDTASLEMVDASMSIDENSTNGTVVGTVTSTYTGDETLNYTIVSGNESGAFTMNGGNGEISVADENELDFETTTSYTLNLEVTDGMLTASARLIVNINDVEEIITGLEDALNLAIEVYPNPVKSKLNLIFSNVTDVVIYDVIDTQGRSQSVLYTTENDRLLFDFSKVSDGIYLILLENLGKRYYLKVLKKN